MGRYIKFVLVICLLAVGVMAVLSVTYPELQPKFLGGFQSLGGWLGNLFGPGIERVRAALAG